MTATETSSKVYPWEVLHYAWMHQYDTVAEVRQDIENFTTVGWYQSPPREDDGQIDTALVTNENDKWQVFVWHGVDPRPHLQAFLALPTH